MATSTTLAPAYSAADARTPFRHQASWGAIFAGAVTALVAQIIINMIGLGVGLSVLDGTGADNPSVANFSTGAGLWWVGSGIVASLIGGYLAGRLSGRASRATSAYHGLVSWAVTTLVVLYLLTSTVGSLVGGTFSGLSSVLGGAGQAIGGGVQTAAQVAAPSLSKVSNPIEGIEQQVRQQAGGQDPQAVRDAAVSAMRAALTGDAAQQKQAEDRAADALARAQNVPVDQARQQVQDYKKQYQQTVAEATQKAKVAAEETRKTAAQGALYAALALVLGAVAALLGGLIGTVKPRDERI